MNWWSALRARLWRTPHPGDEFRVVKIVYSADGKRAAEVHQFDFGPTYLLESDQGEDGQRVKRHSGRLVGPFHSPLQAERFIIATAWFNGPDSKLSYPSD
jgi:hypothetical protein